MSRRGSHRRTRRSIIASDEEEVEEAEEELQVEVEDQEAEFEEDEEERSRSTMPNASSSTSARRNARGSSSGSSSGRGVGARGRKKRSIQVEEEEEEVVEEEVIDENENPEVVEEESSQVLSKAGRRTVTRGRRKKQVAVAVAASQEDEGEEDDDDEKESVFEEERSRKKSTSRKRIQKSRSSSGTKRHQEPHGGGGGEEDEEEEGDQGQGGDEVEVEVEVEAMFSSQVPEFTQDIHAVKDFERKNLENLEPIKRDKAICDLFRVVLFKSHAFEPIDRSKCIKEAGIVQDRIGSAAFEEVQMRLKNLFGYEMRRIPKWMEKVKGLSAKSKDVYYVVNYIEDETGRHSVALHSAHDDTMIEKGLLMVVLALAYCKGSPKHDGSRWILDKDLFYYLHVLDDNIPAEPPVSGSRKKRTTTTTTTSQTSQRVGTSGVSQTPDVDTLLDKFVKREYLMRSKATEDEVKADDAAATTKVEVESLFYSMGPRAALEVGRKQVIYFCGEILGTEPDEAMLKELENDDE